MNAGVNELRTHRKVILSPLRYPGSKKRLAGYIESAIKLNNLEGGLFVEAFAGGASVSLHLLQNNVVKTIGLIEVDPLVAAFWQTVFSQQSEEVEWLKEQIRNIEVNVPQWNEYRRHTPTSTREKALACLFLNRTSFSGILAPGAGPIGGYHQKSKYKIDCRFPREKLLKRIDQAAALRDRVRFVWNLHWRDGLIKIAELQAKSDLPKDIAYYFDPPFFHQAERLYTHFFNADDHGELHTAVLNLNDPWILSYDYCLEVCDLYGESIIAHVELLYSAGNGHSGNSAKEVVISNMEKLPTETRLWRSSKEQES